MRPKTQTAGRASNPSGGVYGAALQDQVRRRTKSKIKRQQPSDPSRAVNSTAQGLIGPRLGDY